MKHDAFNIVREFAHRPQARQDVYGFEEALHGLKGQARLEAERYVLEVWGLDTEAWSLTRLKRVHAFEVALGRPLDSFPKGRYALHAYDPDGELYDEDEIIAEPDAVINPRAFMSFALDMHIEELEAISDDELQDLAHDEMVRLEAPPHPRIMEADSMEALLEQMARSQDIVPALTNHGDMDVATFSDEDLDNYGREAFKAIKDPALRIIALGLNGTFQLMSLLYDRDEVYYCRGAAETRPGWHFVCAWDAIPHRQEEGWCILYKPHPQKT